MIVQKDIAKALGISLSTVSAILGGGAAAEKFRPALREQVRTTAEKMGYNCNEIARAVRTGKTKVIGFVTQSLSNEYVGILLNGVVSALLKENYFVKFIQLKDERNPKIAADICLSQCLAGVIAYDITEYSFLDELYTLLAVHGIPLVLVGGNVNLGKGIRVLSDTEQGGRLVFDYLYSLGHRKIVFASSYRNSSYQKGLLKGIRESAAAFGEEFPDSSVWGSDGSLSGDEILQKFWQHSPTAIYATSSTCLRAMMYFHQNGIRIPEEVSMIGRGNMYFTEISHPSLTVLDENLSGMGKRAAELLTERLKSGIDVPVLEFFPHQLLLRESTIKVPLHKEKKR